jgi:copper resistance protein D
VISAPDIVSVILRALGFVLQFQAAGTAIFLALFGAELRDSTPIIRRSGVVAAALAIPVLALHYSMEAARMAGDFSGVLDASMQGLVMRSSTGEALALRVAGMGLVILALRMPSRRGWAVGLTGALLTGLAFTRTGHTSVHDHRALLATLLLSHVLIGMFWFGALLPLWCVSAREPPIVAGKVVGAFSTTAVWLVPLLLIAGLGMTIGLLPSLATFGQPYGELLIAKLTLFCVLMFLAAANKRRFGPGLAAGAASAGSRFRNTVVAELVLIGVVLAVTACLTTFFSPE